MKENLQRVDIFFSFDFHESLIFFQVLHISGKTKIAMNLSRKTYGALPATLFQNTSYKIMTGKHLHIDMIILSTDQ